MAIKVPGRAIEGLVWYVIGKGLDKGWELIFGKKDGEIITQEITEAEKQTLGNQASARFEWEDGTEETVQRASNEEAQKILRLRTGRKARVLVRKLRR